MRNAFHRCLSGCPSEPHQARPARVIPTVLPLLVLGLAMTVAGCGVTKTSPVYIYVTPPPEVAATSHGHPTPSPTATTAEDSSPSPNPSAGESASASSSTDASPTATASASASASSSPGSTPTPSATPVQTPRPASFCSGSADNQSFFSAAAHVLSFQVYCAIVPSGWWLDTGSYSGGKITITYKANGGKQIVLNEGAFCTTGVDACSPHQGTLGSAYFGNLDGQLDSLAGGGFAVYVAPGTTRGYTATGTGITQAAFVSIVAGLSMVAKP